MVYAASRDPYRCRVDGRDRLFSEKCRRAKTCTPQALARLPHNSLTAAPLQLADRSPDDATSPEGSLQRVPSGRNAGNGEDLSCASCVVIDLFDLPDESGTVAWPRLRQWGRFAR